MNAFTGNEVQTQVTHNAVIYRGTEVFRVYMMVNGGLRVKISTGGFRSRMTKRMINQAAKHFDLPIKVVQEGGEWYIHLSRGKVIPWGSEDRQVWSKDFFPFMNAADSYEETLEIERAWVDSHRDCFPEYFTKNNNGAEETP